MYVSEMTTPNKLNHKRLLIEMAFISFKNRLEINPVIIEPKIDGKWLQICLWLGPLRLNKKFALDLAIFESMVISLVSSQFIAFYITL